VGFVTLKHDHLLFSMFSVSMLVALKFWTSLVTRYVGRAC
jgi:hypothetical protein